MELSELCAYAAETYHIREEHKWADFPGFSVLCHPQTGKWVALLMRQWDTERGVEIARCDLKCGSSILLYAPRPYLSAPLRMQGKRWIGVAFDARTERETVLRLFDKAIRLNAPQGCTIVLDAQRPPEESAYRDTALPPAGGGEQRESVPEQIRALRRMFSYARVAEDIRAKRFYRQAVFMQDYEDDLPWTGAFSCYFPTYRDLSLRQLRGYFTWRAGVRRGEFERIPASAAYLYLYELLNGVGADGPEDVLQKLRAFEEGFLNSGVGDQRIRGNLRRWMLEYAVLHDLPPETAGACADPALIARDEALAVLRRPDACPDDAVFAALCELGGKKLADSPVLAADAARGRRLFSAVWRAAAAFRSEGKTLFTLCFGEKKTRRWYPLSNAVYAGRERQEDRSYRLNDCRSYRCHGGLWTVRAFEPLSQDKARLQALLHQADARLRRYLNTGRWLREKPEEAWAAPFVDAVIEADRRARRTVSLDLPGLERIRRDAALTRDSLLTAEETAEDPALTEALPLAPDAADLSCGEAEETADLPCAGAAEAENAPPETRILRALLRGEDAAALLREAHLMPSIAADRINEALLDTLGDTAVVCEDGRLTLVEDYIEDLTQLLGGTEHGGT
ncbi:MAG: TerB N-terminal domain-containing protein [Oscillospiraceae bacterium]|nr:TerB N-terminal domain-containing protein [Oscillospiraceae bacterium]